MTREEAITKLHWLKAELIKGTDLNEPLDMAIEALSAEAVQGWIPCSERLPSEDGHYLCCNNGYLPYVGCFRNGRWNDFDCTIVHADAWMPLPKPYREESEVEE